MKRDLEQLEGRIFDLLVIGAGIHGASIAWDAALRGLSVAIVEKDDFGQATSANSMKIVHGGLRYLQDGDVRRMRESIRERTALMRIAPHLVHRLPCIMPVYGHSIRGREMMTLALLINDMISYDRNRGVGPHRRLPPGRMASPEECLQLVPGIPTEGLTGGAVWHDCQMYNAERLTLSFILSAARLGAVAANYVKATGFLSEEDCITGIHARDNLTGRSLTIGATTVVNAAGPWADQVTGWLGGSRQFGFKLAKAVNIATRPLFREFAVGLSARNRNPGEGSLVDKEGRLYFVVPWRDQSLIGTTYSFWHDNPDAFAVQDDDVDTLLDDINSIYPPAKLSRADVRFVYGGLVPLSGADSATGTLQRAGHYRIRDHRDQGRKGLISVLGVKSTTARRVAEQVVDLVFTMQGRKGPTSTSATVPLHGGDIVDLEDYLDIEASKQPCGLSREQLRPLICNHGTSYGDVLRYYEKEAFPGRMLSHEEALLAAETRHALRHEMAHKVSDVVFRRTELGTGGHPGSTLLHLVASVAGHEQGWDQDRIREEIRETESLFALTGHNRQKPAHENRE